VKRAFSILEGKSVPLVYFKDCPILFVDNWEQVTEEFLQKSYHQIKMRSKQKALFEHYADLILSTLSS
jgi:hypothetical protein